MSDGGRSSQDQWTQPISRKRWKEVVSVGDLGSLLKNKKVLGKRAAKKARNENKKVLVLADELKAQDMLMKTPGRSQFRGLKRVRKIGEEEDEEAAKELLEDIQDRKSNKETRCGKYS